MPDSDLSKEQLLELLTASRQLNSTLHLDKLLRLIAEAACRLAQSERATIYVLDPETNELWTHQMAGGQIEEFRLPLGKGLAGRAAQTGRLSNLSDAYKSKYFNQERDASTGFRTRGVLTVPFRGRNRAIVGVLQVLNHVDGQGFSAAEVAAIRHLGDFAALALENALFVKALQEKERLEENLIAARRIQHNMLPATLPTHERLDLVARYVSCEEVGGDIYDAFVLPNGNIGLALGDIVGKGLTAAMMMANLQALFRLEARRGKKPEVVISAMNELFFESTEMHQFATFFYGVLDVQTGYLEYCSAGHDPVILITREAEAKELPSSGVPLGLLAGSEFKRGTMQLAAGDVCVVYSDGLTEQHNTKDDQFGYERLVQTVQGVHQLSTAEIGDRIVAEISDFAGDNSADDDSTFLVWKWV